MEVSSISELYDKIAHRISVVYVVPLIRFDQPGTNYLHVLYQPLLDQKKAPEIKDISVYGHIRFVLGTLFRRSTLLHYHWVEFQDAKSLLAMPYKLLCIWLYTLAGGNLVWTVHNLKPHDGKFLDLHLRIHRWMAAKADLIHIHSPVSVKPVASYLNIEEDKIAVLSHPKFPAKIIPQKIAVEKLSERYLPGKQPLSCPLILMPGAISKYKGYKNVINELKSVTDNFSLLIAGYLKKGQKILHDELAEASRTDSRIFYMPVFIPDEDFPLFMSAADICVFNYDEILTSGGVEMALSYEKKIIAPNKGDLAALKDHPLVSLFDTQEELSELLRSAIRRAPDG